MSIANMHADEEPPSASSDPVQADAAASGGMAWVADVQPALQWEQARRVPADDAIPCLQALPLVDVAKELKTDQTNVRDFHILLGTMTPSGNYGPRLEQRARWLSAPMLAMYSLVTPCYYPYSLPLVQKRGKGSQTGRAYTYWGHDFSQCHLHSLLRCFNFLDLDLPLSDVKAGRVALIPGVIDATLHKYKDNLAIKMAFAAFMTANADKPMAWFMEQCPLWGALVRTAVRVARCMADLGFRPILFFTGGKGMRILWSDPRLCFVVRHTEQHSLFFQDVVCPAYFRSIGCEEVLQYVDRRASTTPTRASSPTSRSTPTRGCTRAAWCRCTSGATCASCFACRWTRAWSGSWCASGSGTCPT